MTKAKTYFECQQCGYQAPRWLGRCPECESWGTLVEEHFAGDGPRVGGVRRASSTPLPITEVQGPALSRIPTGFPEVDRTLGGGVVPGSVILVGGDPGIGKSTLLLQVAARIAIQGRKALYVSGEESTEQIRVRAERIGAMSSLLYLAAETGLEAILDHGERIRPDFLVVDSVQTTCAAALESPPGSISQVREIATRLLTLSKERGISTCLIGHVTKEGSLAGPKALEHIVDVVLYLEGESFSTYRLLRTVPPHLRCCRF